MSFVDLLSQDQSIKPEIQALTNTVLNQVNYIFSENVELFQCEFPTLSEVKHAIIRQ